MKTYKAATWTLALITILTLLTGCASEGYNTQKGAVIGAGLGAIAGQVIGNDTASTLIGAGAGALVGGIAGNAVDQKQQRQVGRGHGTIITAPPGQDPPGQWVQMPGQWIGGKWVPTHTVWVPLNP